MDRTDDRALDEKLDDILRDWILAIRQACTSGAEFSTARFVKQFRDRAAELFTPDECRDLNRRLHRRVQALEGKLAEFRRGSGVWSAAYADARRRLTDEFRQSADRKLADYKAATRKGFGRERLRFEEEVAGLKARIAELEARQGDPGRS